MKFIKLGFSLLFIYLAKSNAVAQIAFKADSDFVFYSDSLDKFAHITLPDFNNVDLEMRFYSISLSNHQSLLYLFQHKKTGEWMLKQMQFCSRDMIAFTNFKEHSINLGLNWNKIWQRLLKNNILSLPTEGKVFKKWQSSRNIMPIIGDGLYYRVELLSEHGNRRYRYSNPEAKIQFLDRNNQELKDINEIIEILNNEFDIKSKNKEDCQ